MPPRTLEGGVFSELNRLEDWTMTGKKLSCWLPGTPSERALINQEVVGKYTWGT